ncbi:MAG: glycoside hydrolase family 18 protein, partial [Akkermansiaceae bacterium]|nr:glycoside hydrolase family 18 protein [Akkermansiaceae bacterium]
MTDSVTSIGGFLRWAGRRRGLPGGVVALLAAAAVAAADEPARAAPALVMTWVPPYNWQQAEAMLERDLGGVEMGDALTHLALQFWRPEPATGAVAYVDHEWQTPDDSVVARFKDWAASREVELLLCAYNNDGRWNWELVGPLIRDPAKRAAHVAALVAEARRLGLAGVDIDYEWPGGDQRDEADFLAFVRELSAALRAENMRFFLSTFAHIWNFPNANQWNAIAPWVDGINSMGYGEIGRAGEDWRAYAAQKARINDPRKLLLGMPAYAGGEWLGNTVEEHIDWVVENGGVGIAIWEATLSDNPAWLNPAVWRKLRGLKNPAPPAQGLRVYYDFEQTGAAGLANKAPAPGSLFQATRVGGGAFDNSGNPSGPGFSGKADFNPGNGASDRSALVAGK